MFTVLIHRDGVTTEVDRVDPAWLAPAAVETLWVDIEDPGEVERRLLADVFQFHELAIEDALNEVHHPKIESYGGFLYLILHVIEVGKRKEGVVTHDVDFFLGRNYLVTVRHAPSRTLEIERAICARHPNVLAEGPVAVLHRIVDGLVDNYSPAVDAIEDRLGELERVVFGRPKRNPLREILALKADLAALRRVVLPQRDAIGRLARREFPQISETMSYRFRDVYDHLVRLTDEAVFLQDRVTGLIDAYLSTQSNRLNQVMKVLTVISTIFMPLTVLTGMFGMNVPLLEFPGGPAAQFWWIVVIMSLISAAMLWMFRRLDWL
jgi:magnesium transporter